MNSPSRSICALIAQQPSPPHRQMYRACRPSAKAAGALLTESPSERSAGRVPEGRGVPPRRRPSVLRAAANAR